MVVEQTEQSLTKYLSLSHTCTCRSKIHAVQKLIIYSRQLICVQTNCQLRMSISHYIFVQSPLTSLLMDTIQAVKIQEDQ